MGDLTNDPNLLNSQVGDLTNDPDLLGHCSNSWAIFKMLKCNSLPYFLPYDINNLICSLSEKCFGQTLCFLNCLRSFHSKWEQFERGYYDYRSCGPLLATFWVDKRFAYFLTTIHTAKAGGTTVLRKKKDGTRVSVDCPPILPDYQVVSSPAAHTFNTWKGVWWLWSNFLDLSRWYITTRHNNHNSCKLKMAENRCKLCCELLVSHEQQ